MTPLTPNNSVASAWERIEHQELSCSDKATLVAVGVLQSSENTRSVLKVPSSHTRLPDWDRVGRQIDRPYEVAAALGLISRLIALREYFIQRLSVNCSSKAWRAELFFELLAKKNTLEVMTANKVVTDFMELKPALPDHHRKFDRSLQLACSHFLSRLFGDYKLLGTAAAESCYLYIQAIELLDREVKYPGYLPEAALAAGRHLLCDDQWNVVDGHCQLLFRPACEAMIRAIQIAVLESIASQQS